MQKKAIKTNSQKFTKCNFCGNDITTMLGCRKNGPRYYCSRCDKDVSLKKYDQLIERIRKNGG